MNACYIFLYKNDCEDRLINLKHVLYNLHTVIHNKHKIYIVEIDKIKTIDIDELKQINPLVTYVYLEWLNDDFNRGWGYNYMAKNICKEKVIVMADVDILFQENINILIDKIMRDEYYFCSPYKTIYMTNEEEKKEIINKNCVNYIEFTNKNQIKELLTFAGGILVGNRYKFIEIGGFEEYSCYGNEDRALDVVIERLIDIEKVYCDDKEYIHLYHPPANFPKIRNKMRKNSEHLLKTYGCSYNKDVRGNNPHLKCSHASYDAILKIVDSRKNDMGKPNCTPIII